MINQKGLFSIMLLMMIVSLHLFCLVPLVEATKTLTLNPVADSYINREEPDVNYGGSSYLKVWGYSDTFQYRAYLKFDLTSIPSDAIIVSAKLELYLIYRTGDETSRISIHYCPDNKWTELGITWNNAPLFEPVATYINTTIAFKETWYSWIVTEDVNRARSNQQISWVLVSTSKTIDNFVSKDPKYWSEYKPRLIITFTLPDVKPPQILNITQDPQRDKVEPFQDVKVMASVTDDVTGVKDVILFYTIDDGLTWIDLNMIYNFTSKLYETVIEGKPPDTIIGYKIIAYDYVGNYKIEDNSGQYYTYTVIPEFPSSITLLLLMTVCGIAIILAKKRLKVRTKEILQN